MAEATISSGCGRCCSDFAGPFPARRQPPTSLRANATPRGRGSQQSPAGASSPGAAPSANEEDNPFAPPPENTPDRPWQPRLPAASGSGSDGGSGPPGRGGERGPGEQPRPTEPPPSPWGSGGGQPSATGWRRGGRGGRPGPSGSPPAPKFDFSDPVQRRARYALLGGAWALFFALIGWSEVALLLGALALYWGISSLRGKPKPGTSTSTSDRPAGTGATPRPARPHAASARGGIIAAGVALALVASTFTVHLVYRDYYTCVDDALTQVSRDSCGKLLPAELRPLLDTNG